MRAIKDAFGAPQFVQSEIEATRRQDCQYLMVVCDTFNNYEAVGFSTDSTYLPACDYPIYCKNEAELQRRYAEFDDKNMQEVKAIYRVPPSTAKP